MKTTLVSRLFSFVALFTATPLFCQTSAAPAKVAPPHTSDEVITLSAFNVTADAPTDYAATESTTGTRVASKIRDLPFSVNVVTGELLDDFNAVEFRDQLAFTSNVTAFETISTGYSIRGFDADVQLRNGFRRIGLIDKVNVERLEIIKGPAASIYGAVNPGGTVNVITRRPRAKAQQRVTFTGGTNDLIRTQLSSTGPLGGSGKLFYRVDAAADQRTYDQKFKEKNQSTASLQLLWKPTAVTSLLIEGEWLERRERGGVTSGTVPFRIQTGVLDPYRVQPATGSPRTYTRYVGIATEIMDFNAQGPHNFSNRYVKNLTATFEHQFSDTLSLRSSANWFDRGLVRQEVGGRDQFNPVTRAVQRGTSRYRPFPEGGATVQNDLLASFSTGEVKHKLLLTLDYQRQTQQPEQYDAAVNAAFPSSVFAGLKVDDPDYSFGSYLGSPSLFTTIQKDDDSIDIYGVFLSERASFMNGRLITLAGVRYDSSKSITRDLLAGARSEFSAHALTHQLGVNLRALPWLTLFGNTSKSFVPQFGTGTDVNGVRFTLPNENGRGWDVGAKTSLLDDRLTFTMGTFHIRLDNVATNVTDSTGRIVTLTNGEQASKGFEFDFNLVATRELQFFGGYGYTNSEVVRNENARHLIGSPTRRTPLNTVGLGAKYDFKEGRLKGLFLTAGFKHNDRSLPNPSSGRNLTASASNPIVNNPMPNGLLPFPNLARGALITSGSVRVDDGRETIRNPAYHIFDAGIGHRWKSEGRTHKVQVNAGNLLDRRYTYGSTGQGDRRTISATYDLTF